MEMIGKEICFAKKRKKEKGLSAERQREREREEKHWEIEKIESSRVQMETDGSLGAAGITTSLAATCFTCIHFNFDSIYREHSYAYHIRLLFPPAHFLQLPISFPRFAHFIFFQQFFFLCRELNILNKQDLMMYSLLRIPELYSETISFVYDLRGLQKHQRIDIV